MVLSLAALTWLAAENPVEHAWIRSAQPAAGAAALDVHRVTVESGFVEVESAGLSLQSFGALQAGPPGEGLRRLLLRFPRKPTPGPSALAAGVIGMFRNGVPVHSPASAISYRDQGLWHADAVAAAERSAARPPLLAALLERREQHSPLIGFALDGYPIYGPYGWDEQRKPQAFRSSYQLRKIAHRRVLPGGTPLTPAQDGPPVSAEFPLGTFAEDYEYVAGSGDLDEHNGRFGPAPDYPEGAYAYFTTTGRRGELAFPYLIGRSYRGHVPGSDYPMAGESRGLRLRSDTPRPRSGEPVEWVFEAAAPGLEKVHEKTLHLLVISADLESFAHLHPEPVSSSRFALRHTFTRPGRYRLYADFTPAGGAQTIARFEVVVETDRPPAGPLGEPDPRVPSRAPTLGASTSGTRESRNPDARTAERDGLRVTLETDPAPRAGRDLTLRFRVTNQGQPALDLEPYLGAWGHVVIVSRDGEDFIHAHPKDEESATADPWKHSHAGAGPPPAVIEAAAGFRRPGTYKLWFQTQRGGHPLTFPFVLQVAPGAPPTATPVVVPTGAVRIRVSAAGFSPARITVPPGRPVTLALDRVDAQNCGGRVVFPELKLERTLAPGHVTLVQLPALKEGAEIRFSCGMGMYRGAVIGLAR